MYKRETADTCAREHASMRNTDLNAQPVMRGTFFSFQFGGENLFDNEWGTYAREQTCLFVTVDPYFGCRLSFV